MDNSEERWRELCDIEEIRNLIARYGPLADSGDAQGVAALFAEDGEYDVGGYGVARGRSEIAGLIESDTHRALMASGCAHILSPHHIVIDGNAAVATGYSTVYRKTDSGFEAWRVSANRWELERTARGWLVKGRYNAPLDGTERGRALLADGEAKKGRSS